MLHFVKALPKLCVRAWRALSAVACLLFREGRQNMLQRDKARTDLELLAVEQKRMEIDFQRANNAVDLVKKVENIKDGQLRKKARAAILPPRLPRQHNVNRNRSINDPDPAALSADPIRSQRVALCECPFIDEKKNI
jgi:hypothetical protein